MLDDFLYRMTTMYRETVQVTLVNGSHLMGILSDMGEDAIELEDVFFGGTSSWEKVLAPKVVIEKHAIMLAFIASAESIDYVQQNAAAYCTVLPELHKH